MNIGSIKWPDNEKSAAKLYVEYLIKVITELKIEFSDALPNPVRVSQDYMENKISWEEYRSFSIPWWDSLDRTNETRSFGNRKTLEARVALCLLSVDENNKEELGEHMSWFFVVLEKMGFNLEVPIRIMEQHFDSK